MFVGWDLSWADSSGAEISGRSKEVAGGMLVGASWIVAVSILLGFFTRRGRVHVVFSMGASTAFVVLFVLRMSVAATPGPNPWIALLLFVVFPAAVLVCGAVLFVLRRLCPDLRVSADSDPQHIESDGAAGG